MRRAAIVSRVIFCLLFTRKPRVTLNRLTPLAALITVSSLLAACATTSPPPPTTTASGQGGARSQLKLNLASGVYRCEENQRVEIQRDPRRADVITLNWQGQRRTLQRYDSESGLPRYEDRENGLLWIDLPWKSVLMDLHNERPLANECKASRG